jgi:uncharacterized protein YbbK (DUF523 family)
VVFVERVSQAEVVVSRCIEVDHCRYNGQIISSDLKEPAALRPFEPICPEVEIGPRRPRDP